jgi:ABC-type branched-subunit amino acid transport system substrate-binding protein
MRRARFPLLLLALLVAAACTQATPATSRPRLVVGAVYPLTGPQAEGGRQELGGVRAALATAGLAGEVRLAVVSVETPAGARAAVDRLIDRDHVAVILGTYGSTLSEAAAERADARHTVYWETGAVADLVTQRRHYIFRTVATGMTLGTTAVTFTDRVLLPADGLAPAAARAVIVNVDDVYGRSVGDAEQQLAAQLGIPVVDRVQYQVSTLDASQAAARVAAAHPDYLWDVSYVDDGVGIWRAVEQQGVPLRAAVGTSSAFCMPEFGHRLGQQAVGLYAADKPDGRIGTAALTPAARELLERARAAYAAQGPATPSPSGRVPGSMPIPAVAGFVGGWTLFHEVLPGVRGTVTADAVRAAAYRVDDPEGTSINGGGVRFAGPDQPDAGQNERAPSVVGQWQAVDVMRTVYPAGFATASPLPG